MDYYSPPALPGAGLQVLTTQLARFLTSAGDDRAVKGWDLERWEAAEWVAYWQNAVPWFVERLTRANLSPPSGVNERLHILDAQIRERTRRFLANCAEILRALKARGVEAMPMKGAVLAPLYYADPTSRPMGDIDILVHGTDLPSATEVLRELGYVFLRRSAQDEVYIRGSRKANIWDPDNVYPVELHHKPLPDFAGLVYDLTEILWEGSAVMLWSDGLDATIPRPGVLLHHVCAHATSEWIRREAKIMQLQDVRVIIDRMADGDWEDFSAGISHEGARFVFPALAFARKYGSVSLPPGVLERLRDLSPKPLRNWVDFTEIGAASRSNPLSPKIIRFHAARLLGRNKVEHLRILAHAASILIFPRRAELHKLYPRLVSTRVWILAYGLFYLDRLKRLLQMGKRVATSGKP